MNLLEKVGIGIQEIRNKEEEICVGLFSANCFFFICSLTFVITFLNTLICFLFNREQCPKFSEFPQRLFYMICLQNLVELF